MVTVVAGASTAGAAPLPVANPGTCSAAISGANAVKVTWTTPVPADNTAGFIVTISPGANTSAADTPTPVAVAGGDTKSLVISGLVTGKNYFFTVASTNGQNNTNGGFTNCGGQVGPIPTTTTPPFVPAGFGTNDQVIYKHFHELVQRDPNFSELSFWRAYFQNAGSTNFCPPGTSAGASLISADPENPFGPLCNNSGPEFDLINFLTFGEKDATFNPFDVGGFNGNFDKNTFAGATDPIIRLYSSYFPFRGSTPPPTSTSSSTKGGIADFGGLVHWSKAYETGKKSLYSISDFFAHSSEFKRTYGSLSDADFVTLVYINVLGRNEDFGGQNFWRGQLENGRTRGEVMALFSESTENVRNTFFATQTTSLFAGLLGRVPSKAEQDKAVFLMNTTWDFQATCYNRTPANTGYDVYEDGTNNLVTSVSPTGTCPSYKFYDVKPITQLIASIRNSPKYKAVAGGESPYYTAYKAA